MSTRNGSDWRLALAGVALAVATASAGTPAAAGGDSGALPHACFANDSIIMGKRLAPRPDVVEARLNSPACRDGSAAGVLAIDDAASIQSELDRIDQNLTNLYRAEIEPPAPMSAN